MSAAATVRTERPGASAPLIEMRNVTKRYGGAVALSEVTLEIARGECHAICGENGAGKSTLMKILAGVVTEYEGQLRLGGEPIAFRGTRDAEEAGIAIIHQELNLVGSLTVAANIFLGRELRTPLGFLDDRAMERAAAGLLEEIECDVDPRVFGGSLRVGDQQLIEIAKALSLDAGIVIMDEPTSALTESEVQRLFRVIQRLRDRGVTILYISHKMEEIFALSDRVTVLRDGRWVATRRRSETTPREVTRMMVGREIAEASFHEGRSFGEVVLEVEGLSLPQPPGHARAWKLEDVDLTLRRGEILGIAGLLGAGRTELLESLFGSSMEPPVGAIRLGRRPIRFRHPAEAMKAGLALVSEDRKRLGLFSQMTVRGNISLCTLDRAVRLGLLGRQRETELVRRPMRDLAIRAEGPEAPVTSLSGGNQQKTVIARGLLTEPQVLLLDDPTRGIDVGAKAELYRLIDRLSREGLGIILTSSELPELLTVCDRILVLREGRVTGEFTRAEATEEKIMEAATLAG